MERSITAKSMGELYQIMDRNGERLISAKKPAFNFSLDMDINELLGREVKAKKLPPKDLAMFTRQLEMLLNTGIPMLDALDALEAAAVTDNLKKVVNTLKKRVTGGAQLSAAMDEQSAVFSNFYVKMVQAGEASGTLPNIFAQVREFTERDMEARAKVKKAMRYPMFVVIALFLAGYVQISVVLPKMASTMFSGQGELPLPTRIMLGFSDLLSAYGFIFLVIVAEPKFPRRLEANQAGLRRGPQKRKAYRFLTSDISRDVINVDREILYDACECVCNSLRDFETTQIVENEVN